MARLYTPEQYADLLISKLETVHHAKTGDFLNLARFRPDFVEHFRMAVSGAFEQAISTVHAAKSADIEDVVSHIRKHIPT